MKNKLTLILLFFFSFSTISFGQNKIELVKFEPTACLQETSLHLIQKRIVNQQLLNDTFNIEVATWLNCAQGQMGYAKIANDTLFLTSSDKPSNPNNFIVTRKGDTIWEEQEVADCDCCFHFKYAITGLSKIPKVINLNNEDIQLNSNKYLPPTYRNYFGKSYITSDSEGYTYGYTFYDSQKIKRIRKLKSGYWKITTFYESGGIKRETEMIGDFDTRIETTYDKNGIVLEHYNTKDEN
jgi:hypothetical protein